MKRIGIVCEYNPLHMGHVALLEKAKALGDETVCVMSGHFTQRGDMAIANKYARAEAAIAAGADLVLELPFPYALSGASFFARGALSVLASVGVTHLLFGSETGDLSLLEKASAIGTESFRAEKTMGAAKRHFDMISQALGGETLASNDILGAEYLRAIREGGCSIEPIVCRRLGDGYRKETLGISPYASATAIRQALLAGEENKAYAYMPSAMRDIWERECRAGMAPVSLQRLEQAILFFWRTADVKAISSLAELGGGLAERLADAARQADSLTDFFSLAATKKYTNAHIRRATLYGMLGVSWSDLEAAPAYTELLAANDTGCKLLASLRRKELSVPIVTKPSELTALLVGTTTRSEELRRASALSAKADALYTLALPTPAQAGLFLKRPPFIGTGVDEQQIL